MDPRFRSLVVALAPQPTQMPPPAFDREALQVVFAEITREYPYQQFGFLPSGRGAQFHNGEEDAVELRPALLQIQAKMIGPDLFMAPMAAADKVTRIFEIAAKHLGLVAFIQSAIQIVASVDAPEGDAKRFAEAHLLHDAEQSTVLGDGYFGAGVRFRRLIGPPPQGEDNLSIEPDVNDNALLFVDFQSTRVAVSETISLEQMSDRVTEAFEFMSQPTMRLLERQG
ncbi:MAG: hypothetical protein WA213_15260 [Terriglobales bacterium]